MIGVCTANVILHANIDNVDEQIFLCMTSYSSLCIFTSTPSSESTD
jgi:hypothetical protein